MVCSINFLIAAFMLAEHVQSIIIQQKCLERIQAPVRGMSHGERKCRREGVEGTGTNREDGSQGEKDGG